MSPSFQVFVVVGAGLKPAPTAGKDENPLSENGFSFSPARGNTRGFPLILAFVLFGLFFPRSAAARPVTQKAIEESTEKIKTLLPALRVSTQDCTIAARGELPLTISKVEELLVRPLDASVHLSTWTSLALETSSSYRLTRFGSETLDVYVPSKASGWSDPNARWDMVPAALAGSLARLISAVKDSAPWLKESYADLSEEEMQDFLAMHDYPSASSVQPVYASPKVKRRIYGAMKKFKQAPLFKAAGLLTQTIESELPALESFSRTETQFSSIRIQSEIGQILINGKNDDLCDEKTLENVAILIDLGGKNVYQAAVAGARRGEIRIAIDFGSDVTVVSTESLVSAGAGVFGIGLFYLPNPSGLKSVITDSYSQGMGLCGVGGMFVRGKGYFYGERYLQGVGSFGLGVFSHDQADESLYDANRYAQGVGFTRGVGIFRQKGSRTILRAGLVEPDPRESLGTTSLCQGVGFGPRGYAGGGLGLCALEGDGISLESSYFAQGAGYWHAAGSFMISGSSNTIKARRYDQGSGIHVAVGSFFVQGDDNHIVNWGVGPAYGWDAGLGWSVILGNRNSVQTEWGAGTASYNRSRTFSLISGDDNRLDLPGWGNAGYGRDLADYGIARIEGENNRFKFNRFKTARKIDDTMYWSPWGMIRSEGVVFDPKLEFPKPEWKLLPRQGAVRGEGVNLGEAIQKSVVLQKIERIEPLVRIASVFSVDQVNPRKALYALLSITDEEIPALVQCVDPADLEGFIQIRSLAGILGERAAPAVIAEIKKETDNERRAWLINLLPLSKCEKTVPFLLELIGHEDFRTRGSAVRSLGLILNKEDGHTPGRVQILSLLKEYLSAKTVSKAQVEELDRELSYRTFAEAVSYMGAAIDWSPEERKSVLDTAPQDIAGNYERGKPKAALALLEKDKKRNLETLEQELRLIESLKNVVRDRLVRELAALEALPAKSSKHDSVIYSIILALGQIGEGKDAEKISNYLGAASGMVRDAASASLGRIGKPALKSLNEAVLSADPNRRVQAIIALQNTTAPSLVKILYKGLKDPDSTVRKIAVSIVDQMTFPLRHEQTKIRGWMKKHYSDPEFSESEMARIFVAGE